MGLTPENLRSQPRIRLAHGTSSVVASAIRLEGLKTQSEGAKAIADGLKTNPGFVYLKSKLDFHYFDRAINEMGGEPLLVVVEVPIERLDGDENWFSEAEDFSKYSRSERLIRSLQRGQCKHLGSIPPDQIRHVFLYRQDRNSELRGLDWIEIPPDLHVF